MNYSFKEVHVLSTFCRSNVTFQLCQMCKSGQASAARCKKLDKFEKSKIRFMPCFDNQNMLVMFWYLSMRFHRGEQHKDPLNKWYFSTVFFRTQLSLEVMIFQQGIPLTHCYFPAWLSWFYLLRLKTLFYYCLWYSVPVSQATVCHINIHRERQKSCLICYMKHYSVDEGDKLYIRKGCNTNHRKAWNTSRPS